MRYHWITPFVFIAPMLLGILLFRLGPILAAFVISFTSWNIRTDPIFIGLGNYIELWNSSTFWLVLKNTFLFAAAYVPGVMIISLAMAMMVNQKIKGIALFRGLFFMPYITSMVAVALVWNWIFSTRFGLLNTFLRSIGISDVPRWLADSDTALLVLIIVTIWKTLGFQMMIFLAGLQSIPPSLYEAARIDGANAWQMFRNVTLPLLTPVTFFVLIISIFEAFQTFEVTYAMTGGGPLYASTTLPFYIYLNAFEFNRMGFASATAYILMLLVGLLTVLNFSIRRRWVVSDTY
jgi:multiple sugar transport system permease protein